MRKIVGIGETIMDIIFKDGQPTASVPGGSVFNGIVSLGRLHQNVTMITETGNDRVGQIIEDFMLRNGVNTDAVCKYDDGRTAISLAFLNERNDAEYSFYKDYPKARLNVKWPEIKAEDVVMMGSYFVLNPVLRSKVKEFLDYATGQGAVIYYDINFRSTHRYEADLLRPTIMENFRYASILRGSTEDFQNMFGTTDAQEVYDRYVSPYCPVMLCTDADGDILAFTPRGKHRFAVDKIQTVSTIGAGDNFNAGCVYGLMLTNTLREDIVSLDVSTLQTIVGCGKAFAANVCQSYYNSISTEFAEAFLNRV